MSDDQTCDVCMQEAPDGLTCAKCIESIVDGMLRIPRKHFAEILRALEVRDDWYISRRYPTPPAITAAMAAVRRAMS